MVNKPLIRPYFVGGVALGVARIPLTIELSVDGATFGWTKIRQNPVIK